MSGIAAIIHFDGRPVAAGDIAAMTGAMAHRGPDGIQHVEIGAVALGHCMMHTTAESLDEVQPCVNLRGDTWLVVDGWLDNWEELRVDVLKSGGVLRNRTDAELILAAYELWGEDCVLHMGGDFAFVIWDAKRQTAFCARDRVGNKPLVYYRSGTTLVVASEPCAILALPWVPRVPNEGLLAERLAGEWLSRDETLWTEVLRLVASHRLSVTRGQARLGMYWQPDVTARIRYKRDEDYFSHYRELFLDSVRRSARSHRPVAYEVSGGLDSSAVFCGAKHLLDAQGLAAPSIHGYTLDFSGDMRADELAYARSVSEFLKVPIAEVAPTIMPLSWYVTQASDAGEHPTFPTGSMSIGIQRLASHRGSRVIVNGCGGDEWLAGSRTYYAEELAAGRLGNFASCLAADARSIGVIATGKALMRYGAFALLPKPVRQGVRTGLRKLLGRSDPDYWISQHSRNVVAARRASHDISNGAHAATVGQRELLETLHAPFRAWGRESVERLHAHAGLEGRRPMDTPAIIQFAFSVPERLRLRGDTSKFVHVHALRDLVPAKVLDRKTKSEFSIVMRRPLDQQGHRFFPGPASNLSAFLDEKGLSRLFRHYRENPQVCWPLWVLWLIHGSQQFASGPQFLLSTRRCP